MEARIWPQIPVIGVTDVWKHHMGSGNQTQVPRKGKDSLNHRSISSAQDLEFLKTDYENDWAVNKILLFTLLNYA